MKTPSDDDRLLDQALITPLLDVPGDFADRVLAALPRQFEDAPPSPAARLRQRLARWLKTAALAAGSAAGLAQVLSFAWGLWTATAAGVG
ncbi:hypothetical protein [Azohydromonas caseinilytica]|uniref:Uncharacterized protein n=1 Tax=Azohydromonas caseinilytica TaxID=2728836 RepID=A0A848F8U3_9BURK|nr:hypothetical protein [Azohydromonas caseinilytica]NML15115.1 hypothetical protein [Azohydromonas caseinilytica]